MITKVTRKAITRKRHQRIRRKVSGTMDSPRLAVYRSGKHIYAQIIDDLQGLTLASASSLDKTLREELSSGANVDAAKLIGSKLAERALQKGIKNVKFDRGGFLYHGRIAALADAAREAGLEF